jgi:hypothetical protein
MTDTSNNGGPAYPYQVTYTKTSATGRQYEHTDVYAGMTLRDYFAAAALQGMLADIQCNAPFSDSDAANDAYKIADAMLAERAKQ